MTERAAAAAAIDPHHDSIASMTRVLYLHPEQYSRNKHYEAFKLPRLRFARRVARLLQSLRRDLLTPGVRLLVEEADEGRVFLTQRARGRVVRRTLLTEREFALLMEDETLVQTFPELSTWFTRG